LIPKWRARRDSNS